MQGIDSLFSAILHPSLQEEQSAQLSLQIPVNEQITHSGVIFA